MHRLICTFVVTNHRRQFFSVAVQLLYVILPWALRNQDAKFDFREIWYNLDRIVICAVSSKHLQCVCRHTKSYPASDRFLYYTIWYTTVNMVIIELYKPRATHMKYIGGGGGIRNFLNRNRLSYFILQDIPGLFSNLKCSNMQLYIRRWYIICMCKISVQNDIIKDILKKKNDVHWISDFTVTTISQP